MEPEECPELDKCYKVTMVFDKDLEDFQYARVIREVCARCTGGKTNRVSVATMERQLSEPDFIKRHVFEALYASIAEAGGDIALANRLRARTKFWLVNMSDEQMLALAKAIAPPE